MSRVAQDVDAFALDPVVESTPLPLAASGSEGRRALLAGAKWLEVACLAVFTAAVAVGLVLPALGSAPESLDPAARISLRADVANPAPTAALAEYREMVDRYAPRGYLPNDIVVSVAKSANLAAGPTARVPVLDLAADAADEPFNARIVNIAADYKDYVDNDYYRVLDHRHGRAQILMHEVAHVLLTSFMAGVHDGKPLPEFAFPMQDGRRVAQLYSELVSESFADAYALMLIERRDGPGSTDHFRVALLRQRHLDALRFSSHITHDTILALHAVSDALRSPGFHRLGDAEIFAKALEISLVSSARFIFGRQAISAVDSSRSAWLANERAIHSMVDKIVGGAERALNSFQKESATEPVRLPAGLRRTVADLLRAA